MRQLDKVEIPWSKIRPVVFLLTVATLNSNVTIIQYFYVIAPFLVLELTEIEEIQHIGYLCWGFAVAFCLGRTFCLPFVYWSQKWISRKVIMSIGFFLSAVFSFLLGFTLKFEYVLFFRFLGGIVGFSPFLARSLLKDISSSVVQEFPKIAHLNVIVLTIAIPFSYLIGNLLCFPIQRGVISIDLQNQVSPLFFLGLLMGVLNIIALLVNCCSIGNVQLKTYNKPSVKKSPVKQVRKNRPYVELQEPQPQESQEGVTPVTCRVLESFQEEDEVPSYLQISGMTDIPAGLQDYPVKRISEDFRFSVDQKLHEQEKQAFSERPQLTNYFGRSQSTVQQQQNVIQESPQVEKHRHISFIEQEFEEIEESQEVEVERGETDIRMDPAVRLALTLRFLGSFVVYFVQQSLPVLLLLGFDEFSLQTLNTMCLILVFSFVLGTVLHQLIAQYLLDKYSILSLLKFWVVSGAVLLFLMSNIIYVPQNSILVLLYVVFNSFQVLFQHQIMTYSALICSDSVHIYYRNSLESLSQTLSSLGKILGSVMGPVLVSLSWNFQKNIPFGFCCCLLLSILFYLPKAKILFSRLNKFPYKV